MRAIRNLVVCTGVAWLMLPTPSARAAELQDGAIVHVRLVSPITSEGAKAGETIRFVVASDLVIDGAVVIARKTPAAGTVVAARRASWGFIDHHGVLAFAFLQTTGVDGQPIRLRATSGYGLVNIDRGDYHHNMQWATEGDVFEAAVAGDYVFRVK
jgi:hypothetical protein